LIGTIANVTSCALLRPGHEWPRRFGFQIGATKYHAPVTESDRGAADAYGTLAPADPAKLRVGLIDGLRASRAAEREVFDALDPATRDVATADGEWSAKDILAHLSGWRQRMSDDLAGRRQGRQAAPAPDLPIDEINSNLHAERADWPWDRVVADAEATSETLAAEVSAAADDVIADPKIVGSIMGDGPEHDLGHLTGVAATVGKESQVLALADTTLAILDRGGWPSRSDAHARYNLACFHALGGNLDVARSLLRQALPQDDELRTLAPKDDDLIALRAEIPTLAEG
jgi:hypothetical protein